MNHHQSGVASNVNIKRVDWKWSRLDSDIKPGPPPPNQPHGSPHGVYLGSKVHWMLTRKDIRPGAQLIKIGRENVTFWKYQIIRDYLDKFLRDDRGPNSRYLTFRNHPQPPPPKTTSPSKQRQHPKANQLPPRSKWATSKNLKDDHVAKMRKLAAWRSRALKTQKASDHGMYNRKAQNQSEEEKNDKSSVIVREADSHSLMRARFDTLESVMHSQFDDFTRNIDAKLQSQSNEMLAWMNKLNVAIAESQKNEGELKTKVQKMDKSHLLMKSRFDALESVLQSKCEEVTHHITSIDSKRHDVQHQMESNQSQSIEMSAWMNQLNHENAALEAKVRRMKRQLQDPSMQNIIYQDSVSPPRQCETFINDENDTVTVREATECESVEIESLMRARFESLESATQSKYVEFKQSESNMLRYVEVSEMMNKFKQEMAVMMEAKNERDDEDLREENEKMKLEKWMENEVKLPQYLKLLKDDGFDDLEIVQDLTENDLRAMGIDKTGHRRKIIKFVGKLKRIKHSSAPRSPPPPPPPPPEYHVPGAGVAQPGKIDGVLQQRIDDIFGRQSVGNQSQSGERLAMIDRLREEVAASKNIEINDHAGRGEIA